MGEVIDYKLANQLFHKVAANLSAGHSPDARWRSRIEEFSAQVERVGIRTYIAMLGTACLAKAVNPKVNVFSLKSSSPHEGSYSARAVATKALVPAALEARVHLGVTGREPLNNQPFFRLSALDDGSLFKVIKTNAKSLAQMLLVMLEKIQEDESGCEARTALAAFISVRRDYWPKYGEAKQGEYSMPLAGLCSAVAEFVRVESEGGRRAQAVAAALFSSGLHSEVLCSDRVNDPDRHFPGDLGIYDGETDQVIAAVEVRDKPVASSDVLAFAQKCAEACLSTAGVVAAVGALPSVEEATLEACAFNFGVELRIYESLPELVREALMWSSCNQTEFIARVHMFGRRFLARMEVSVSTVETWDRIFAFDSI